MTMRSDATRIRIATADKRRARAVVARQGQVLLDTDVDQQSRHHLERVELETVDTLGSPGRLLVPTGNDGFEATPNGSTDVAIAAGHGYLDGWLLENPDACKVSTQPHPRTGDPMAAPVVVAVKSLIRHVDPVEEPVLADAALGDAQASGRSLVDWQVIPVSLPGAEVTCGTVAANATWLAMAAPSTGRLTVIEQTAPPSTDPCSLTPGGGYSRLENLLYRLEVHGGAAHPAASFPTIDGPRFKLHGLKLKMSRRNASVMVRIVTIAGSEIQVAPPVLDPRNWFAPGLFGEIVSIHDDVDPRGALANERLFRVALATDDRVTLEATAAQIAATGATNDGTWFLRLWDAFMNGEGLATVAAPNNAAESAEIDLGDGLRAKLDKGGAGASGTFRRGDHWTFAARADGSIDWLTVGGTPQAMPPHGPETRYAPLAVFNPAAPTPVEDCRAPFATLSDRTLLYRGGDGQSVLPKAGTMVKLPAPLRVAVMRGETPVVGATVRWSFVGPAGRSSLIDGATCDATTFVERATNAQGLVEVPWSIDGTQPVLNAYQVRAELVSGAAVSEPAIVFSATFSIAEEVGYTTDGCATFQGIDNVGATLDKLVAFACNPPVGGDGGATCCHTVGIVADVKGEFETIIEAIAALREAGHTHICLCLLPGEHTLDPGELKEVLEGITELVLSGRGATLLADDAIVFSNLSSVVLRDIVLTSEGAQALEFIGSEEPRLDVELTEITVTAREARAGQALVTLADCRRVRILRSTLRAPASRPDLRDVLPDRFAAIVEMAESAERPLLASRFGSLVQLPAAARNTLVRDFGRALERHRDVIDADDVAIAERSIEALRAGTAPSPQRLSSLIADWRHLAELFGPRSRGWPVAIAFVPASGGRILPDVDVVIDGSRITGGVILGGPHRDIDADATAEQFVLATDGKVGIVPDGSGRMRLEGNVLGWLGIGTEQAKLIGAGEDVETAMQGLLFAEVMISGNTFTSAPHAVVAGAVTAHGNVFELGRWANEFEILRIGFAESSVVAATGNLGPVPENEQLGRLVIRGDVNAAAAEANARLSVHIA